MLQVLIDIKNKLARTGSLGRPPLAKNRAFNLGLVNRGSTKYNYPSD